MYQIPSSTDRATKLPIKQDAWLFVRFDQLELLVIKTGKEDVRDL